MTFLPTTVLTPQRCKYGHSDCCYGYLQFGQQRAQVKTASHKAKHDSCSSGQVSYLKHLSLVTDLFTDATDSLDRIYSHGAVRQQYPYITGISSLLVSRTTPDVWEY